MKRKLRCGGDVVLPLVSIGAAAVHRTRPQDPEHDKRPAREIADKNLLEWIAAATEMTRTAA